MKKTRTSPVEKIDLRGATDAELERISSERLLALNLREMKELQRYYVSRGRPATDVELECIAQTWSEHCKHKVFNGITRFVENGREELIDNLFLNTIVRATEDVRRARGKRDICVSVFRDNAGVIRFDSRYNLAFKVETHNHPSALDPYGGANTGIGGVIRDPLGTGLGAKPVFCTDVFCFAAPDFPHEKLPKGVLHPKRICKGVVAGVRDYGNKMGIPTVNGSVQFDRRYLGNPIVYCGTGGLIPRDRCVKRARPGDLVVAIGGRTGRDGIHGATFASLELDDESEVTSSSAVQIGNPIEEKKMLDVILQARGEKLYNSITDCGAGGFSSAVGEMGQNIGAELRLERAPLKYGGLLPWEILLSEAQERMILAVPPENLDRFMELCRADDVEATVIGKFKDDKKFSIFYKNSRVGELDMDFLHRGVPRIERRAVWKKPAFKEPVFPAPSNLNPYLHRALSWWDVASKEWVVRQYDHEVQGGCVLKPLQGAENDGPGDAAVLAPVLGATHGFAVSHGISIRYGDIDPYHMAASAIDEALRGAAAVGADPDRTAILDNFAWGNPDKPDRLGALVRAARACRDVAATFLTPFISGKDSFYNEFTIGNRSIAVPPTLLISAVGLIDDVRRCVSMDAKEPGNPVYVLGRTYDETGGSVYFRVRGYTGNKVPRVRARIAKEQMLALHRAINEGTVRACHDVSDGGLAVAFAEMAFAGGFGMTINSGKIPRDPLVTRNDTLLFSESNSRFVIEVDRKKEKRFREITAGLQCRKVGTVTAGGELIVLGLEAKPVIRAKLDSLKSSWKKPLGW
ncbi:MAG: phosphoribosylformylglycinamidine synthase subunit PurL [bacterium]